MIENREDEDISPIRAKSKLKKRRRQRESTAASLSLLSDYHNAKAGDFEKEIQYNNNSMQKENNNVTVRVAIQSSSTPIFGVLRNPSNPFKGGTQDDTARTYHLCFMDKIELSQLFTIRKDIIMSSPFMNMDVALELERAFAPKDTIDDDNTNNNNINDIFYHDVGRIGPPIDEKCGGPSISISFPPPYRCNNSPITYCSSSITKSTDIFMSSENNFASLQRQTCYGISIPLSFCQFPGYQSEPKHTKTLTAQTEEKEAEEEVVAPSSYSSIHHQGIIRITSERGATIREAFDIDESDYVIGKLNQGDERYFLEKRILSAPPPNCDDDDGGDKSDGDDDEDCVDVVRYKIVLNEHDCIDCSHEKFVMERDTHGKMVGWISDRGRLADDPYFITKEV